MILNYQFYLHYNDLDLFSYFFYGDYKINNTDYELFFTCELTIKIIYLFIK